MKIRNLGKKIKINNKEKNKKKNKKKIKKKIKKKKKNRISTQMKILVRLQRGQRLKMRGLILVSRKQIIFRQKKRQVWIKNKIYRRKIKIKKNSKSKKKLKRKKLKINKK